MKTALKITALAAIVAVACYSGFAISDAPGSPRDLLKCLWLLLTVGW